MDYMQKAADLVADAKTIEKLDEQTKELKELIKQFGLSDYKADIRQAENAADAAHKKYYLHYILESLDNLIGAIMDINDDFDYIMDAEDEKAYKKEQEREEERVRALGGITFKELEDRFCKLNREGASSETAVIVFKPESFPDREYTEEERSYRVSSDNKMFKSGMCGYSLFGVCLANSDEYERLDYRMRGYEGPRWIVDYCRLEA